MAIMQSAPMRTGTAAEHQGCLSMTSVPRHALRHLYVNCTRMLRNCSFQTQWLGSERAMTITCRATGIVPTKRKAASTTRKPSQRAPPCPRVSCLRAARCGPASQSSPPTQQQRC